MSGGNAPYSGGSGPTLNDAMMLGELVRSMTPGFGAIAYSRSTERYGYSYGFADSSSAERTALAHCGSSGPTMSGRWRESDAHVVISGRNTWLALAVGDGGTFGCAERDDARSAARKALKNCRGWKEYCRLAIVFDTRTGSDAIIRAPRFVRFYRLLWRTKAPAQWGYERPRGRWINRPHPRVAGLLGLFAFACFHSAVDPDAGAKPNPVGYVVLGVIVGIAAPFFSGLWRRL